MYVSQIEWIILQNCLQSRGIDKHKKYTQKVALQKDNFATI